MASQQLVDAILPLIRLISDAICCQGHLNVGYTRSKISSNQLFVEFYQQLFNASLCVSVTPLTDTENHQICRDFINFSECHPQLFQSWFLQSTPFVPLEFFLENFSLFPRLMAKCFQIIHQFPRTEDMEKRIRRMHLQIAWEPADGNEILSAFWKVQFFEELMAANVPPNHMDFLYQFLILIKECKALIAVSFYLLEVVDSCPMEAQVISVLEHRLLLLSSGLLFNTIGEHDMLGIMENIGELFELGNVRVIRRLIYDTEKEAPKYDYLHFFHNKVVEWLYDQERFLSAESEGYQRLASQYDKLTPETMQLACQKAIPRFLFKNLRNFFLNSLLINRSLTHCISQLVEFDFLHNTFVSTQLYACLLELLNTLDMVAFRNCLLAETNWGDQEYAYSYNWLGAKQNIILFEKILAFSYAGLKAKKKYKDCYLC